MPEYQSGFLTRLYFSLVTASAKGAAQILTDSEFSRVEIIREIGVPPEMVTAIPLGVTPDHHPRIGAERDPEIRARYNLPEQYVLYMGGFDLRKNVLSLLNAYTF